MKNSTFPTRETATPGTDYAAIGTTPTTALEAMRSAIDLADLAYSTLQDLEALFTAIKKESDEHSQARLLAGVGQYLASDWGNMFDVQRGTLDEAKEALKAGASPEAERLARLQRLADIWTNGVVDDHLWGAICDAMARTGCPELDGQEGRT